MKYPFQEPLPALAELSKGQANVLANLSSAECRRRLKEQTIPVRPYRGPAKGVGQPLNLDGPIGGVQFQLAPPSSPYGVLDCRMVLLLAELAKVLTGADIVRVRIDNAYRPQARLPGGKKRSRKLSQHAHGLALDIVSFTLKDGRTLDVEEDWHGARGEPPCGETASIHVVTEEAVLLRNLTCSVARAGLFHHMLTPNYDAAHKNHLHWDIKRDNKWFSIN